MNAVLNQLHGLTLWLAIAIVVIGLGLIGWMLYEWMRARRQLAAITANIYEASAKAILSRSLHRERVRALPDGRQLIREHPDQTIEAWLERYVLHRVAFEAGAWITGLALICTFFLIAAVLAEDVGPAIQSKTGDIAGLAEAVRKMGAKFVVSLLGILMTIIHGVGRSWLAGNLHDQASALSDHLAARTVVLADYHAELNQVTADKTMAMAEKTAQIYGLMHAQHQELIDKMAQLSTAVSSLGSIEVSVRDIGSELAERLQHVVKEDIVAGIRRDLEEVTDTLCDSLSQSFATTVHDQLSGVNGHLQKIETAIASQAHGQVEELLNKLGDAVSGGFTSESSRMKEALSRFVEVVPLLEQQMRTMVRSAGEDLAKRGVESARMSEALIGKLERVLAGIETQQRSSAALGEQMTAFVAQTEQTLTRSVTDAQEQMSARSKVNLDQLTEAVRSATGDAAEVYRALTKEIRDSASVLRAARTETAEASQALAQSAQSVREIGRYVNDSMGALQSVSESLATNVDAARGAVNEGALVLKGSIDVARQQRQFVDDLSGRWPQLTREYLEATNQAFSRVSDAWTRHVGSIESSVGRISNGFNDSASEFASAVDELGKLVQDLKQAVQLSTPARIRAT